MSLLSLGPGLLELLAGNPLGFAPILADSKDIVPCDLALVEGCLRNAEDIEKLSEVRRQTKTLIAFGTCASFGGIPGLASAFSTADLLLEAYGKGHAPDHLPILEP